eukprot:g6691.t1
MCGATTSALAGAGAWRPFGTRGVYFAINGERCGFAVAPQYAATLLVSSTVGAQSMTVTSLRGTAAVASVSTGGFTWAAGSPHLGSLQLRRQAQLFRWRLGWIGASGPFTGITRPGHTGWKQWPAATDAQRTRGTARRMFVDVNIRASRYATQPRLFASLRAIRATRATHTARQNGGTILPLIASHGSTAAVYRTYLGGHAGVSPRNAFRLLSHVSLPTSGDGIALTGKQLAHAAEKSGWVRPTSMVLVPTGLFAQHLAAVVPTLLRGEAQLAAQLAAAADDDAAVDAAIAASKGAHAFFIVPTYVASLVVADVSGADQALPAQFAAQSTSAVMMQGGVSISRPTNHSFVATVGLVKNSVGARSGLGANTDATVSRGWRLAFVGFGVINCAVSQWSTWSTCDRSCGGGVARRYKRIVRYPQGGGKACPPGASRSARHRPVGGGSVVGGAVGWEQRRPCNSAVQCIGTGASRPCGGTSLAGTGGTAWFGNKTRWRRYGTRGVYVDVDTSACAFRSGRRADHAEPRAPPYITMSVIGDRAFADDWQLTGTNALAGYPRPKSKLRLSGIAAADDDDNGDGAHTSADGFRAIVLHPSIKGPRLLKAALRFGWRVSWIGDEGRNCGRTIAGRTGWKQTAAMSRYTVYADVQTIANGYDDRTAYPVAPRFFTALL